MSEETKLTGGSEYSNAGQEVAVSNTAISTIIRNRIKEAGAGFLCNDNISDFIHEHEKSLLLDEVSSKMDDVLRSLVIDVDTCHNTSGTARRVAKMWLQELYAGRYNAAPPVTSFPNVNYDELYIAGPITLRSSCAHHQMPIFGKVYVGVYPGKRVIGLSKFNRIVDWFASRPSIQEELTVQIADELEKITEAEGLAIIIRANHGCVTMRGVQEACSDMTTSVMRGIFKEDHSIKQEFISLVGQMQ